MAKHNRHVQNSFALPVGHWLYRKDVIELLPSRSVKRLLIAVNQLFREAKIQPRGQASYDSILRTMLTPMPDY